MSTSNKLTVFTIMKRSKRESRQAPEKAGFGAVIPMRQNALVGEDSADKNSQDSILSGALRIINPSIEAPAPSATRRRGSLASRGSSVGRRRGSSVSPRRGSMLSERRSSELQLDNADRLSGLMLDCKQVMDELDRDYESDFDE